MGIGRGFDTGTNVYVTVCDINFLRFQVQTRLQGILLIIKSVLPGSFIYRMRAVISRGLYIFYPISKDHFFVFKEVFQKILSFCMARIQERFIMARAR